MWLGLLGVVAGCRTSSDTRGGRAARDVRRAPGLINWPASGLVAVCVWIIHLDKLL